MGMQGQNLQNQLLVKAGAQNNAGAAQMINNQNQPLQQQKALQEMLAVQQQQAAQQTQIYPTQPKPAFNPQGQQQLSNQQFSHDHNKPATANPEQYNTDQQQQSSHVSNAGTLNNIPQQQK
jgi:hypothetical protein